MNSALSSPVSRRTFLQATIAGLAAAGGVAKAQQRGAGKTILLRSGWQTVNIGDIGHTPGALRLIEEHVPGARVILWPGKELDRGVEPMLMRAFPDLRIVYGGLKDGRPAGEELAAAWDEADLLMYGSGPHLQPSYFQAWHDETGKPLGSYGNTISGEITDEYKNILPDASFVFSRETKSYEKLVAAGITGPEMGFAPDATFGIHLLDEEKGLALLGGHGLAEKEFICVVPRLRYTPYHKIYANYTRWDEAETKRRMDINEQHAEADHAKARAAIVRYVRETGRKVLVCPEMTYQVDIIRPLLVDPLPADVKPHVFGMDRYWLPDEAGSVYKRAECVVSFECHSPIIAFAHGTPAFYLRQPEDTIKGQMWYDIGADDWVFEIDETSGEQIAAELLRVASDRPGAEMKLQRRMDFVRERQRLTMAAVGRVLGGG